MKEQQLRDAGLKVTIPRKKILDIFTVSPDRHLSAEDIHAILSEQNEEVGLATVYRVLIQFEEVNLIIRHNFDSNHAVFELNQGDHHDHLICIKCQKIEEFYDELIEARQKILAEQAEFHLTGHALIIYGICKECSS